MFEFPSLLWFLPLVGLPILIHLINVLRHQRVKWAAMEFLLQSQKRHRTWVMLKQLLLLLLRMAAVAAVVLMLAQPQIQNTLAGLVGGSKTHHIVLLDDSFSMSDHWADTSAFKQATDVIARLGNSLSHQGGRQEFTLLLYSQAAAAAGRRPCSRASRFRRNSKTRFRDKLLALHPSELAVGPAEGLSAIEQMVRRGQRFGNQSSISFPISAPRIGRTSRSCAARSRNSTNCRGPSSNSSIASMPNGRT